MKLKTFFQIRISLDTNSGMIRIGSEWIPIRNFRQESFLSLKDLFWWDYEI